MAEFMVPLAPGETEGRMIRYPDQVRNAAVRPEFAAVTSPDLLPLAEMKRLIVEEAKLEESKETLPPSRQMANANRLREIRLRLDADARARQEQRETAPVRPPNRTVARPAAPVAAMAKQAPKKQAPVVTMATNAAVEPRWPKWMTFSDRHALIGLAAGELKRIEAARRAG